MNAFVKFAYIWTMSYFKIECPPGMRVYYYSYIPASTDPALNDLMPYIIGYNLSPESRYMQRYDYLTRSVEPRHAALKTQSEVDRGHIWTPEELGKVC